MTSSQMINSDYQVFLKLMTEQMRNQDPLAPMDATQFVTQLAQFSQVEQSIRTNSKLDDLMTAISSISSRSSLALIGRNIEVAGSVLNLEDGEVDFSFAVQGEPAKVRYTILNSAGHPIRTETVVYGGGRQSVTWDGLNDQGEMQEDGTYAVVVEAIDAEGNQLPTATFVTEKIKQIIQEGGRTVLVLESGEMVDASQDMVIS